MSNVELTTPELIDMLTTGAEMMKLGFSVPPALLLDAAKRLAALASPFTAPADSKPKQTAKQQYDEHMKDEEDEPCAIERLRFFLSFALHGDDWLDVEAFLDDLCRCAPKAAMRDERILEIAKPFIEHDGVMVAYVGFARAIRGEQG